MKIDNLSNSQLILLVLLITLVVSAATAISTLSLVHERLLFARGDSSQPTIIQQTINRIIERDTTPVVPPSPSETSVASTDQITLDAVGQSLVQVYHGSRPVSVGIFVSSEGMLLVPGRLLTERRYNVKREEAFVPFAVLNRGMHYTLLTPFEEEYTPVMHIPFDGSVADVPLGEPVLIFGGFGEDARLHREIVSQKQTDADGTVRVYTAVPISETVLPSVVFVGTRLAGFMSDYTGWIPIVDAALFTVGEDEGEEFETAEEVTENNVPETRVQDTLPPISL